MDRAELELVTCLASTGSLTAAADELHIAQPALSRRLARLEREVGAPLFVRGRHGTVPTSVGVTLVARADQALTAIRLAERDTADAVAGRIGVLRIGTTPTLGADVLPAVLAGVRASHPDVQIDLLISGDSGRLRDDVAEGHLDVAVAVLDDEPLAHLRVAVRFPQRFVLVVPEDHRLARHASVRRDQLRGEAIVSVPHGEGLRVVIDSVFAAIGSEPEISIETSEREMLIPFVTAGLGVTLVPEVFARQRAGPGVRVVTFRPPLERTVGAVVREGPVPPPVAQLVETIRGRHPGRGRRVRR